jgi:hypothetical protein
MSLGDANMSLGDANMSLGDANMSLGDANMSLGGFQAEGAAQKDSWAETFKGESFAAFEETKVAERKGIVEEVRALD